MKKFVTFQAKSSTSFSSIEGMKLGLNLGGYGKIERDETDVTISRLNKIAEILDTLISTILSFDAKNVFHQYNNHHSVITGYNHQLNLNGSIDRVLTNMQSQIDELKNRNG